MLGDSAIVLGQPEADFSRPDSLSTLLDKAFEQRRFEAVINAAAYTAVDLAESEEPRAHLINAESPGAIARWCAEHELPLVHYSTDYVFSGQGERPWREDDPVAPLGAYGRTKLAGEQAIMNTQCRAVIFRTSWVYDAYGKNFVRTMLKLGAERETLKVVSDQHGAPTYAPSLARATLQTLNQALEKPHFPTGIYHLCNSGETTWHEFATRIFEQARILGMPLKVKSVEAIPSSAYPTPAHRPLNSRLDQSKIAEVFGIRMPDWHEGLADCIKELK
jgi:dTDP-4-dehydrorhamnose reductase